MFHWHHLPWCLQHSSPLSRISPLLPAECIAAVLFSFPNPALPVLLSALLLILFFMYFFFNFQWIAFREILPKHTESRGAVLPVRSAHHISAGAVHELLVPQTDRASLIPPVGIISHGAVRGCAQLGSGTGNRDGGKGGRMWGCSQEPLCFQSRWTAGKSNGVPDVVSSYLHL